MYKMTSKEKELGWPFSTLKPGTLQKLGNRLSKPKAGVFLTSWVHWAFLDADLKELKSLEARTFVDKAIPFPDGNTFVGVDRQGIAVYDFNGKVLQRISAASNDVNISLPGYRKIFWAIPVDSNTVVYAHDKGDTEDLISYSLVTKKKTILNEQEKAVGRGTFTKGLFKLNDKQYIRFYREHFAIGNFETGVERKGELKTPLAYGQPVQVIQVASLRGPSITTGALSRFFTFGARFQVIDIWGDGKVSRRLLDKTFLDPETQNPLRFYCAAALNENAVVMMSEIGRKVYFLDLESGEAKILTPETNDIESKEDNNYPRPVCALAVTKGLIFMKSFKYPNGLLVFDPKKMKQSEGEEYTIDSQYVHGRNLVKPYHGFQYGKKEEPVREINLLEPYAFATPEYTAALKATLQLADVPGDIQGVIAKFLM